MSICAARAVADRVGAFPIAALLTLSLTLAPPAVRGQQVEELAEMSLDSLLNIRVSAASRYEQLARAVPAATVVVTADAIRRHRYQTLGEVLEDVAGFYTSYDRNYTYLGVRGFGRPTDYNNRILVLLDGQQLNEGFYGSVYGGPEMGIDLRTLDRIEIVRGPGSAIYGSSAMFAVINLVPARDGTGAGWASGRVGSLGTRAFSAGYGLQLSDLALQVGASALDRDGEDLYYPEYDSPETNHGVAEDLDWERQRTAYASARLAPLSLQLRWSERDKGLPTGSWDANFNDPSSATTDDFLSAELRLDLPLAVDKQLTARLRRDRYVYTGMYPYPDSPLLPDRNDVRSTGMDATLTWDLPAGHRLLVGAEGDWYTRATYWLVDTDTSYFHGDFPYRAAALFAQSELHLRENLMGFAGLRQDWVSGGESALSPRLGVIYSPDSASTIKLLWGRAFRAPNVYERVYEDVWHRANPDIAEEVVSTAELVVERRLGRHLIASGSLFNTSMKGLIDQAQGADEITYFRNLQAAHSRGAEAELIWRRGERELRGSYSYAYTIDSSTDERLTNSPAHLFKTRLGTPLARLGQLGTAFRCETGRTTVWETRTDAFCLSDATFTVTPSTGLDVTLQVRNALNTAYAKPGGWEHRQSALLQEGRTLALEVQWRF